MAGMGMDTTKAFRFFVDHNEFENMISAKNRATNDRSGRIVFAVQTFS